jgi:alkylhydroperoxidase family enzyme
MTPAEQVAVAFATRLATDHLTITDADKSLLRAHFNSEQIVELGLLSVMCLVGRFSMLAGLEEPSCPV